MATVEVGTIPDRIDVLHLAGKPFELDVPVLDSATPPVAVPFAGVASARAHVRPSVDSDQILYVFSTDDVGLEIVDDGGDAVLRLSATSEITSDWQVVWPGASGQAVVWWDLEITDDSDETHQVTSPGTITLIHQVTR